MVLHACHVAYVYMVKRMFDLAQLRNEDEMKYFNALINSIAGDEDQQQAAIEYLKQEDPEIWGDNDSN